MGRGADNVLGFLVGLFGNVLGLIGTIVVMFLWAGNATGPQDSDERHAHARSVSLFSGLGCLLPIVFVVLAIIAFGSFAIHTGFGPDVTPFPVEIPSF